MDFGLDTGNLFCLNVENNLLFSGSADQSIRVWDLNNLSCKKVISPQTDRNQHQANIYCLTSNSDYLFSGSWDTWIKVKKKKKKKIVTNKLKKKREKKIDTNKFSRI